MYINPTLLLVMKGVITRIQSHPLILICELCPSDSVLTFAPFYSPSGPIPTPQIRHLELQCSCHSSLRSLSPQSDLSYVELLSISHESFLLTFQALPLVLARLPCPEAQISTNDISLIPLSIHHTNLNLSAPPFV